MDGRSGVSADPAGSERRGGGDQSRSGRRRRDGYFLGAAALPECPFRAADPCSSKPARRGAIAGRRRQLLLWAAQNNAWIIEDDYDSEFRYHGKPLPPLKSLDAPQRVIYAGAFSKSLFPALRAAWLVVPEPLVAQFREQALLMCCSVPTLWQQTLADFIREGHFWRHLKKMRASYAQRRLWLESALRAQGFTVVPQAGGIQMVVRVAGDDRPLAQRARRPVWPYRR